MKKYLGKNHSGHKLYLISPVVRAGWGWDGGGEDDQGCCGD